MGIRHDGIQLTPTHPKTHRQLQVATTFRHRPLTSGGWIRDLWKRRVDLQGDPQISQRPNHQLDGAKTFRLHNGR